MRTLPEQMFIFRLARELGMTVSRMLAEMDSIELSQWMAFFAVEEEGRKQEKQADLSDKIKASLGGPQHGKKSR